MAIPTTTCGVEVGLLATTPHIPGMSLKEALTCYVLHLHPAPRKLACKHLGIVNPCIARVSPILTSRARQANGQVKVYLKTDFPCPTAHT